MDKLEITYKGMSVSILYPGTRYRRSRFDWTGMVEQISLGSVRFLGMEADGQYKGTEGIGLSSEFGIKTPLSYWRTLPGKEFMKIGVGALRRDSIKPYNFFRDYPVRPFETEVRSFENKVEFIQKDCSAGPYRCDYQKTIEIADRELIIHSHLINKGERTIKTEEYCHNFFRPGDAGITGSTYIETSHPLKSRKEVGPIRIDSGKISFPKAPDEVFYTYGLFRDSPKDFTWKIADEESGLSVTGIEDFPVSKFALWGMSHVISPETFHSFILKPREDLKWRRKYRFKA